MLILVRKKHLTASKILGLVSHVCGKALCVVCTSELYNPLALSSTSKAEGLLSPMDEIMQQIHQIASERQGLYRKASKGPLSPDQKRRIDEINAQLPLLWDRHRRDLAARVHANKPRSLYDFAA